MPRWRAIFPLLCSVAMAGCQRSPEQPVPAAPVSAPAPAPAPASAPAPAGPALAVTAASWSPDALDTLLAPVALYPDPLVGQILAASVNPQEVLDAGNWLLQNQGLHGDALDAAALKAGFGPATRALVQFPTVMDMLCQQIDWTRQLGSAFTSDQAAVLASVQRLRGQAAKVGNLRSTPQQVVASKTENQKTIIEIQPADPKIIYVPQYNPQVVYTTPPPPPPPPAPASSRDTVSTDAAVAGGLLAFGVGVLIGSAIHNDEYCYPHWGAGAVFVGPRPFYPPAYVYRPAYGPAFHPAYRYAPPAGYRNGYNNVNVNRNINVNNNYFNQFNHNQNFRGATVNNLGGATRNSNWKGQTTYAGAANGRRSEPVANARPARASRPPATRAAAPTAMRAAEDRGYGGGAGGAGVSRAAPADHSPPAARNDHAFSGATNPGGGGFDRAASARGHASLGSHGGSGARPRPARR